MKSSLYLFLLGLYCIAALAIYYGVYDVWLKTELLTRGCTCDDEQKEVMLTSTAFAQHTPVLDDGSLLQTLTSCVAQLERQPLTLDIKTEVENAQIKIISEKDDMDVEA